MKVNYYFVILLALCWIFIASGADSEVKVEPKTSLDPKISSTLGENSSLKEKTAELSSVVDTKKDDHVKEGKTQAGGSEKSVETNKLNPDNSGEKKQVETEKDKIQLKNNNDDKKKKPDNGSTSKGAIKEVTTPVRKEGSSHVEECDDSNSCKDEKNGLVACLRVPGNESPELSLLVQNKGKGTLSVTISAPDYVQLEKTKIQVEEKENNKVKVSIDKAGANSLIVLKAGDGNNCILDFREIIALNLHKEESVSSTKTTSTINIFKRTPIIAFVIFGALVVIASAWMCISFRKRYFKSNNSSSYHKMDMELPVSGGAKVEFDSNNDGWDNSWGDDWDDEEAPKTPVMPLTPSLSSKGLAPRRLLNKEGWKD